MPATEYTPGETMEEIFVDERTGGRYDSKGNQIVIEPQNYSPDAICQYSSIGQPLKYADVYPGPVNVHQNVPLSDFAIAFEIDSGLFIAPIVAPVKTVGKRSDIYYKISKSDILRPQIDDRAVGGLANEIQTPFDTDNYQVKNHALREFLPDETADNADEVLQLTTEITRFLTTVIEYGWDRRVVNLLSSGISTTTQTLASAPTGGKIPASLSTTPFVHRAFNFVNIAMIRANAMVGVTHVMLSANTAQAIAASDEMIATIKYTAGERVIADGGWAGPNYGLPEKLYGKRLVVLPHVTNTAAKGQADVFADLLTDTLMFLSVQAPGIRTRNAVTTFRKGGITVRSYRDEGRKGQYIEVEMIQTEKITNTNGLYSLTAAVN